MNIVSFAIVSSLCFAACDSETDNGVVSDNNHDVQQSEELNDSSTDIECESNICHPSELNIEIEYVSPFEKGDEWSVFKKNRSFGEENVINIVYNQAEDFDGFQPEDIGKTFHVKGEQCLRQVLEYDHIFFHLNFYVHKKVNCEKSILVDKDCNVMGEFKLCNGYKAYYVNAFIATSITTL